MKQIRTLDAIGHVLSHDITQIIKDEKRSIVQERPYYQGRRYSEAFVRRQGKYIYFGKQEGMLHENEAAEILYSICGNKYMKPTEVSEGKIEVIADADGLFKLDVQRLCEINSLGQMMIAARHGNTPVKHGDKLAGTRVIPLIIEEYKMKKAQEIGGGRPIMEIMPFKHKKVGIVTTGSEVFHGRIKDTFGPVIIEKFSEFDAEILGQEIVDDNRKGITDAVLSFIGQGADIVVCTGA